MSSPPSCCSFHLLRLYHLLGECTTKTYTIYATDRFKALQTLNKASVGGYDYNYLDSVRVVKVAEAEQKKPKKKSSLLPWLKEAKRQITGKR